MVTIKGLLGGHYRPLTESDVKMIHETSLSWLEDPGIQVNYRPALDVFHSAGAGVDFTESRVRIPRSMVEEALASAPSTVRLCGRKEENDLILEKTRTYMGTGGTVLNALDLETGEYRPTTINDIKNLARLVDGLENVHFFMLPVYPNELEVDQVDINRFWWGLTNSSKHIMGGVYSVEGVRNVISIAEEIAGGPEALRERPIISMVTCIISPLVMDNTYTELLMEVARQGIPLVCPAEPLAGATSPSTLAATVAVTNTETLSGIVLSQLVNRGTPVIYGTVATTMDMKSGSYLAGNVEMGLISAGCAQMAQFYEVPIYATAGMTESKMPDIQAGYEKAITSVITALAGANYIHDAAGFIDSCTAISYEQLVIDSEIIGMCMRAVQGIEVTTETLAEEVVRKVGPGGNFLTNPHTLKYFKKEFFYPRISDRQQRRAWEKSGKLDAVSRAREIALDILNNHQPEPLPEKAVENITRRFPSLRPD